MLTIHPDKCKIVIISCDRFVSPLVTINNKQIEVVKSSKCLGLTIDSKLTKLISKFFSGKLKSLYYMRSFSTKTLATIYNRGILPSVLYGILIWRSSNNISEVNKIHIRAARYVKKIKRNVNDNEVLQAANWKRIVQKIFHFQSSKNLEQSVK